MRKIRWEGLIPFILFSTGVIMTLNDEFMTRLAESTDHIFWVVLLSWCLIQTTGYMFPKQEEENNGS